MIRRKRPAPVTFSAPAGTYVTSVTFTLDTLSTGCAIYYTTDGSTPRRGSTRYTGAVTLSASATVRAVASAPEGHGENATSHVSSAAYVIVPATTSELWTTAYWQAYQQNWSQPVRIDWTAVTHLAAGVAFSTATGGLVYGYGLSYRGDNATYPMPGTALDQERLVSIVAQAHAAGRKVILQVGGDGDLNLGTATNATYRSTFVYNILNTCTTIGIDGVDIDWEQGLNTSQLASLIQDLHAGAPAGFIIALAAGNSGMGSGWRTVAAANQALIDQVNIMSYDMGSAGAQWWMSPLASPAEDGRTGMNTAAEVGYFTAAGVAAAKIGIGIHLQGRGPTTGKISYGTNDGAVYGSLALRYRTQAYHFDTSAGAAEFTSGAWMGFDDPATIAGKATWVKAQGVGGCILFTPTMGNFPILAARNWHRNPQMDAAKRGFLSVGPSKSNRSTSATMSNANGSSQTLTIPSGATRLLLHWRALNVVGFDARAHTANVLAGAPTAYRVDVLANGVWQTGVVSVPTCYYCAGLHAIDASAYTNPTQVRMVMTGAPRGGAGTTIDLALHDAREGSGEDTFLMVGDSLTTNEFVRDGQGAYNPPGSGFLGDLVNAQDSTRFPVVVAADLSGGYASYALRTTSALDGSQIRADGGPLIRSWLEDYPALNYICLEVIHNDISNVQWKDPVDPTDLDAFQATYETMIKEIMALGRTPVLPFPQWTNINNTGRHGIWVEAWGNRLWNTVVPKYPTTMEGPNLYTNSYGLDYPTYLMGDHTHLTTAGAAIRQTDWRNWLVNTLYAPA